MIFAATKDTYFQKQLIKNFHYLSNDDFIVTDSKQNKIPFVIGKREDCKFTFNFRRLFKEELKDITFRQFFHILKIDYGVAVSNFTTNSPLYFSDKYTPNFPVLEAVGASMSIPPAIRPLYNASDVVFKQHNVNNTSEDTNTKLPVNGKNELFVKNGKFSRSDYELYEFATKKALQEIIKSIENINIDLNNINELNTFLDYLQLMLIGVRNEPEKNKLTNLLRTKLPYVVEVNSKKYEITDKLILFFYNAQFKGLLIDGGYFNNIPFNYFRGIDNDSKKLDGVFAIKLDRSFPPDFMEQVRNILEPLKHKEEEIIKRVEREEMELGNFIPLNSIDTSDFDKEFEQVVIQIEGLLQSSYLEELKKRSKREFKDSKGNLNKEEKNAAKDKIKSIGKNRKIVLKIIHDWYIQNGVYNEVKPWEIPRPILQIAFTGYEYGAKRGQIRDITDHKHIVALYDYGVGTYDFDLDKVRSLAEFAQKKAQNDINVYFEQP